MCKQEHFEHNAFYDLAHGIEALVRNSAMCLSEYYDCTLNLMITMKGDAVS